MLADAVAALRDLHTVLFQCGNGELGGLAGILPKVTPHGVTWNTEPGTYQPPHPPEPAPPTLRMLVPHTTPGTLRT
jgi:hypothetical protein